MNLSEYDLSDPAIRKLVYDRVNFLCGFHSVIADAQTHQWTMQDTESVWQEQVKGRNPGWGSREEAQGYLHGVLHGKQFLEARLT